MFGPPMLALPANWRLRMKFIEAVDDELMMAPRPPTPVPEITNCLFTVVPVVPKISSVPPLLMVMLEPVPPSDEELITWSVPADSVIAP